MAMVEFVRWPVEGERREALRRAGRPRILVLADGATPPTCDALEDWVRRPVSREDVEARAATLRARATLPPTLADRLLSVDEHTMVLTAGEARLVRILLRRFGEVFDRDVLVEELWGDGPLPRRNALDLRVLRLRRRLEPVGLTVRTVWGRGYLLARSHEWTELAI